MAASSAAVNANRPQLRRDDTVGTGRRVRDWVWWGLCLLGLALLCVPVIWTLEGVIAKAIPGWSWIIFTEPTTGVGGGLSNTIAGTGVLLLGVGILAGLIGIGTGMWLSEVSKPGRVRSLLRSASEVLSGVPSIVLGYVGYVALVVGLHWGFSLIAALIVLAILVVPYVAKSTEIALNQVPLAYREGGEALGMTKTYMLRKVVMRSAIPGMATGLIVALAISVGETAPLLYTAGFSNSYPSAALVHTPVPYLTYATWTFYDDPLTNVKALSYDSAVLLVTLVLLLVLLSRFVVRASQRYSPERATGSGGRGERRAMRVAQAQAERAGSSPTQ